MESFAQFVQPDLDTSAAPPIAVTSIANTVANDFASISDLTARQRERLLHDRRDELFRWLERDHLTSGEQS